MNPRQTVALLCLPALFYGVAGYSAEPVATADAPAVVAADTPAPARKPLNLSVDKDLLMGKESNTQPHPALLTDQNRQLAERLKTRPQAAETFGSSSAEDDSMSIGGGLITRDADLDPGKPLDSVEGAKVNLDMKF